MLVVNMVFQLVFKLAGAGTEGAPQFGCLAADVPHVVGQSLLASVILVTLLALVI